MFNPSGPSYMTSFCFQTKFLMFGPRYIISIRLQFIMLYQIMYANSSQRMFVYG